MIVVDTNIVIYLLVNGEFTEFAEEALQHDKDWVAPLFMYSELRNVLMGYVRRGDLTLTKAIEISRSAALKVQSRHVDGDSVLEIAAASGCTAYDSEFVSLAIQLNAPLVTSDKKMLTAFPDVAVSIMDFAAGTGRS